MTGKHLQFVHSNGSRLTGHMIKHISQTTIKQRSIILVILDLAMSSAEVLLGLHMDAAATALHEQMHPLHKNEHSLLKSAQV